MVQIITIPSQTWKDFKDELQVHIFAIQDCRRPDRLWGIDIVRTVSGRGVPIVTLLKEYAITQTIWFKQYLFQLSTNLHA